MRIASRELRNDTAGVLRRAAAGELVEITVNGEAVAELVPLRSPRRSPWTPRAEVLALLQDAQADPGLSGLLEELAGDTAELGSIE